MKTKDEMEELATLIYYPNEKMEKVEKDGVIIQKDEEQNSIKSSIKKSVKELNEVKTGNLKAKDVSELLSAL